MKSLFFASLALLVLFSVTACDTEGKDSTSNTSHIKSDSIVIDTNTIFVYYFHGSIRCRTCVSVDKNTHKYLQELFPKKMGKAEIIFNTINIDNDERPDLVNKYEIYGQTMLFVKGDRVVDETDHAFQYVITAPDKWKEIVEDRINNLIN